MPLTIAEMTIDVTIIGQPDCCKEATSQGWQYSFCEQTQFVSAAHPSGGRTTIAEVYGRSLGAAERKQIGEAIAMLLNGGNHKSRQ